MLIHPKLKPRANQKIFLVTSKTHPGAVFGLSKTEILTKFLKFWQNENQPGSYAPKSHKPRMLRLYKTDDGRFVIIVGASGQRHDVNEIVFWEVKNATSGEVEFEKVGFSNDFLNRKIFEKTGLRGKGLSSEALRLYLLNERKRGATKRIERTSVLRSALLMFFKNGFRLDEKKSINALNDLGIKSEAELIDYLLKPNTPEQLTGNNHFHIYYDFDSERTK